MLHCQSSIRSSPISNQFLRKLNLSLALFCIRCHVLLVDTNLLSTNRSPDSPTVLSSAVQFSESKYSGGLWAGKWGDPICDTERVTLLVSRGKGEGAHMCTLTMFPARSADPWCSVTTLNSLTPETETTRGPHKWCIIHCIVSGVTLVTLHITCR